MVSLLKKSLKFPFISQQLTYNFLQFAEMMNQFENVNFKHTICGCRRFSILSINYNQTFNTMSSCCNYSLSSAQTNASKRHMVFWWKTLHFKCRKKPGESQFDWWQWSYYQETPVRSDFRNKINVLSDAAEPASLSICAMENDHVNS